MNILNFLNWEIISISEEETHFFIRAKYVLSALRPCPKCKATPILNSNYGTRLRTIKDFPIQGKKVSILLTIQRYKCSICRKIFSDKVSEISPNFRATKRFIRFIERESAKRTFYALASETGFSENTIGEIFTKFIERKTTKIVGDTPQILGIDEVYCNRIARCILTNIQTRRIVDILPKKDVNTIYRYLIQMPNKSRIKVVTMDMCRPYFDAIKSAFPKAEVVVDTFHIQRMANKAMNSYLNSLRILLSSSQRRLFLHDRFILLKRPFDLTADEKLLLATWMEKLPLLRNVYELKEEFLSIWRLSDRQQAENKYCVWKNQIPLCQRTHFSDILTAFKNWHHEIFNYFDYKVTNAFTESANRLIKFAQKESPRASFEVIRAKMLCKSNLLISLETEECLRSVIHNKNIGRVERLQCLRESNDIILQQTRDAGFID